MMKTFFFPLIVILLMCNSSSKKQSEVIINAEFRDILYSYIANNMKIPNSCDAKPYYEISFAMVENDTCFAISAFIGQPGSIPPTHPDSIPPSNPREIKGAEVIKNRLVVIYDFKYSNGYGFYNPASLSKERLKDFEELHDTCYYVEYPESKLYGFKDDSIFFKEKLSSF